MIWPTHNRFRNKLSAYMDGELSPREDAALEAHVASCRSCARELAGLRLASAALREMPEAAVPRSFALTPDQAARPARALRAGPSPTLMMGPRLAAGALAVALAVVVFIDVGNVTDTQNTPEANTLAAAPAKQLDADSRQSPGDKEYYSDFYRAGASPEATSCGACSGISSAGSGSATGGFTSGTSGTGGTTGAGGVGPISTPGAGVSSAGAVVASAPTAEPGGVPVPGAPNVPGAQVPPVATGVPAPEPSPGGSGAGIVAPTTTPAAETALNTARTDDATKDVNVPASASVAMQSDSGNDTLLLAEIGLAVALALALFASAAVTYAGRRRMR